MFMPLRRAHGGRTLYCTGWFAGPEIAYSDDFRKAVVYIHSTHSVVGLLSSRSAPIQK